MAGGKGSSEPDAAAGDAGDTIEQLMQLFANVLQQSQGKKRETAAAAAASVA